MIHTMELTIRLLKDEFQTYKRYVAKHMDEVTYQDREGYKLPVLYLDTLKEHGLRFCIPYETYDDTGWNGVQLYAEVNFSKLANFESSIQVAALSDLSVIRENFTYLTENAPFVPCFARYLESWNVHRVDYSVNCHTPEVATYLKLLKHGDRVNRNNSNRNNAGCIQQYDNFHHPVRNSSGRLFYTFNFYDKEAERIDRGKGAEEIAASKDILRIEMQCHAPKVKDLCRKFGIPNEPTSFFNIDICRYVLLNLGVDQIVKDAPFYRRASMIRWIKENTKQERQKRLLQALNQVNENGGNVYKMKQSSEKFPDDLKVLTRGGRNIITLRDGEGLPTLKYSTIGSLASIQSLVRAALEEEDNISNN